MQYRQAGPFSDFDKNLFFDGFLQGGPFFETHYRIDWSTFLNSQFEKENQYDMIRPKIKMRN